MTACVLCFGNTKAFTAFVEDFAPIKIEKLAYIVMLMQSLLFDKRGMSEFCNLLVTLSQLHTHTHTVRLYYLATWRPHSHFKVPKL